MLTVFVYFILFFLLDEGVFGVLNCFIRFLVTFELCKMYLLSSLG